MQDEEVPQILQNNVHIISTTVHLKMVKMVGFTLRVFHQLKKKRKDGGTSKGHGITLKGLLMPILQQFLQRYNDDNEI